MIPIFLCWLSETFIVIGHIITPILSHEPPLSRSSLRSLLARSACSPSLRWLTGKGEAYCNFFFLFLSITSHNPKTRKIDAKIIITRVRPSLGYKVIKLQKISVIQINTDIAKIILDLIFLFITRHYKSHCIPQPISPKPEFIFFLLIRCLMQRTINEYTMEITPTRNKIL